MPARTASKVRRGAVMRFNPLPKPYSRIRFLLRYLGYDSDDIAEIVEQLRRRGTADGCGTIDQRDRGSVEFLLSRPDV